MDLDTVMPNQRNRRFYAPRVVNGAHVNSNHSVSAPLIESHCVEVVITRNQPDSFFSSCNGLQLDGSKEFRAYPDAGFDGIDTHEFAAVLIHPIGRSPYELLPSARNQGQKFREMVRVAVADHAGSAPLGLPQIPQPGVFILRHRRVDSDSVASRISHSLSPFMCSVYAVSLFPFWLPRCSHMFSTLQSHVLTRVHRVLSQVSQIS